MVYGLHGGSHLPAISCNTSYFCFDNIRSRCVDGHHNRPFVDDTDERGICSAGFCFYLPDTSVAWHYDVRVRNGTAVWRQVQCCHPAKTAPSAWSFVDRV